MSTTPTFEKPPVVELVLGAQFSPLTKLTAGHFGLFWNELGPEWAHPSDGSIIEEQFELFDRPKWATQTASQLRIEPVRLPGRFLIEHKAKDRLIQIQATRFHLNWRKSGGFYPSYKKLIAEFEDKFNQFTKFANVFGLGTVTLNQWELTYIDSFPQVEYWQTPADWAKFLPGLFGPLYPYGELGLALEHRAAEWSYEIEHKQGRLHIAAAPGRWGKTDQNSLLLQMTARGPIGKGGAKSLRTGLDLGHHAAVQTFLRVVNTETQTKWGEKL